MAYLSQYIDDSHVIIAIFMALSIKHNAKPWQSETMYFFSEILRFDLALLYLHFMFLFINLITYMIWCLVELWAWFHTTLYWHRLDIFWSWVQDQVIRNGTFIHDIEPFFWPCSVISSFHNSFHEFYSFLTMLVPFS